MRVLLFGQFSDSFPERFVIIEGASDLASLQNRLMELDPIFTNNPYRIAVNRKLAEGNQPIFEHDEVAVLPPFAGG